MLNTIDLLNVELTCNDQVFFEILKMKIRSISISHSITKTREEKDLTLKLEKDILNLEDIMNSAPSELIQSSLNNKKKIEFERKREEKVEGILLRSKANWHENGEKCSQYFCKLEKKNFIKKNITELIDDAGHHISDQSKILLQQHDFYKTLYSTTNLDCNDESFFNHNIKLTEEQKYLCEGNITFKECAQSLKLMTNGKSPGSDGYTVDFYKFFWEDIGPLLYRSLYLAYESGSFTDFQYQGVITCIPKEGKDRHFIGNWRLKNCVNSRPKSVFKDQDAVKCLSSLHDKYVIVPVDKASNNIVFVCKSYYFECLIKELGINSNTSSNTTYKPTSFDKDEILANHRSFMTSLNIPSGKEFEDLPYLYWIPKLHKTPYKERYITGSSTCSTKELSIHLTKILSAVKEGQQKYCETVYSRSGINHMWILKNSKDLLDNLKSRSFSQVSSIKTFDFSTLYTTLPHDKLKTRLKETIHKAFSHRNYGSKFVVLGYNSTYFSNKIHKGKNMLLRGTSDQYAGVPH